MQKYLINKFIKHKENNTSDLRKDYGLLCGIVGIITNSFICLLKILSGLLFGSIAIVADGMNNLFDTSSSIITVIGFKVAAKEKDKEHPYGHGRYEYLAALVISISIIIVGALLLHSSVDKIFNPKKIEFNFLMIFILFISIIIKIWQTNFNLNISKIIKSKTLKAVAIDSRNDVIATSVLLVSLLVAHYFNINIDGYAGAVVSLFIIISGIQLLKDTVDLLLGQAPDPDIINSIKAIINNNKDILGVHDLVIHDYGPQKIFASVHLEFDAKDTLVHCHSIVEEIEQEIQNKLGIELVSHIDPIELDNPLNQKIYETIKLEIKKFPAIKNMHDLRVITKNNKTTILFELILENPTTQLKMNIENHFLEVIKNINSDYQLNIIFDLDYSTEN
ncbi:MAG: cation diffusion facilitator family transporter [Erysipelotrichaceae bacterium]